MQQIRHVNVGIRFDQEQIEALQILSEELAIAFDQMREAMEKVHYSIKNYMERLGSDGL